MSTRPSTTRIALFWAALVISWLGLVVGYALSIRFRLEHASPLEATALVAIGFASSIIWLGGIRSIALWGYSAARRRKQAQPVTVGTTGTVAMLYCVADDFNPGALRASMAQDYPVTVVILDDSSSPDVIAEIDTFATDNGCEIVRRLTRTGFKAGNVNHGIRSLGNRFTHVVIVDSDGILPTDFVSRALGRFAQDPTIGIVQGSHEALGQNAFGAQLSGLLGTQEQITQPARSEIGLSMFLGRSAVISVVCWRDSGAFPEVVAEDVAFTVESRIAGYRVSWMSELATTEDYPIDYRAFRTQQTKSVEGAMEFLMSSTGRVLRSRLKANEKADVILELAMIPLGAAAGIILTLGAATLVALRVSGQSSLWVAVATGISASAPLVPFALRVARRDGVFRGIRAFLFASALYGSTLILTARAALKVLFGRRAVFVVTPKRASRSRFVARIALIRHEIMAAATVAVGGSVFLHTLTPVLPFVAAAGMALVFVVIEPFANRHSERGDSSSDASASSFSRISPR